MFIAKYYHVLGSRYARTAASHFSESLDLTRLLPMRAFTAVKLSTENITNHHRFVTRLGNLAAPTSPTHLATNEVYRTSQSSPKNFCSRTSDPVPGLQHVQGVKGCQQRHHGQLGAPQLPQVHRSFGTGTCASHSEDHSSPSAP